MTAPSRYHFRITGTEGRSGGSACGIIRPANALISTNPEAVTCQACRRTYNFRSGLEFARTTRR